MLKSGWILSNNERGDVVIQKDDECTRFESDDDATEFVVKDYLKTLEELEGLKDKLEKIAELYEYDIASNAECVLDDDLCDYVADMSYERILDELIDIKQKQINRGEL
jgi:hypothetical protein